MTFASVDVVEGFAAPVDGGRVVVRVLEVALGRVVDVVVDFAAVLGLAVVAGFFSPGRPTTLDLRSAVEVAGLVGARVEVVLASDMRLAAPDIPFFSSPELATDLVFSSAELLIEALERCVGVVVVVVDPGLRAVELVEGRVGGLFKVLPLVDVRLADVPGLAVDVVVELPGRLAEAELDRGRLDVVDVVDFLAGDAFSLLASGLDFTSDLDSSPDKMVESTGVAGGASSTTSATGVMGSSVEAMIAGRVTGRVRESTRDIRSSQWV